MADKTNVVSSKIDDATLEALDIQCELQHRNRSQTLELALQEWLERQAKVEPKTKRKVK